MRETKNRITAHPNLNTQPHWTLLLSVTALAIVGIFIGNILSKKVSASNLKKGFGWFVLVTGVYIIVREIFFPGTGSGH